MQIEELITKFRGLIEEGNLEELATSLSELESLEDKQKGYIVQLETEHMVFMSNIKEQLGLMSKMKELSQDSSSSGSSYNIRRRATSLK